MNLDGISWMLCLLFGTVITELGHQHHHGKEVKIPGNSTNSTNSNSSDILLASGGGTDSPETIQGLNPWVRIPDDWTDPDEEDTSKASVEVPTSAESRYYGSGGGNKDHRAEVEPFFEHAMMTNISEQVDSHVFLRCRVKNLGDRTVSWIRRRDWHILTSARTVYTNDDRFKIRHTDGTEEWILVIEFVQTRDDGTYECQVSTSKGTISHFFNLEVLVPKAFILGAKEYHVQQGTVISLVCIVENSPRDSPQYLYWYHNNLMVNYGTRVSVHTEPGIHTHSRLTVASAGPQHSGNYTCKASNTEPASVSIFVSEGDKTAAMQGQGSKTQSLFMFSSLTFSSLLLILL